jgi:hypothetical protein
MPALTMDGAVMKAQLAAYRRTLAMTFDSAASLDGVVATDERLVGLSSPGDAARLPGIEALVSESAARAPRG